MFFSKDNLSDSFGILMSCLCCIHCVAAPLLIIVAPWTSSFFDNELFHIGMILFVIPTALFAFTKQYKKNQDIRPVILGVLGVILIIMGVLTPELQAHNHHEHTYGHVNQEIMLTVIGSLFLVVGHFINLWNCRCKSCHH